MISEERKARNDNKNAFEEKLKQRSDAIMNQLLRNRHERVRVEDNFLQFMSRMYDGDHFQKATSEWGSSAEEGKLPEDRRGSHTQFRVRLG